MHTTASRLVIVINANAKGILLTNTFTKLSPFLLIMRNTLFNICLEYLRIPLVFNHLVKRRITSFGFAVVVSISHPLAANDIQIGIYHSPSYNYISDNSVVGKDVDLARKLAGLLNTDYNKLWCQVA
jgi:hypothetical protein